MGRGRDGRSGRPPGHRRGQPASSGGGGESGYLSVREASSGIRFVFKSELSAPELLHIYARHLTTPEEAIETFFTGETTWNEHAHRYETFSGTHGLFWYWLEADSVVMIVSCFRLEGT